MQSVSLLLLPLAFLSACKTPQSDITPGISSPVSQASLAGKVIPLGPVVQIMEYFLTPTGEKTVTLNGKELSLNWRLKNTYEYDAQKRLTHQKTTVWNNSNWWEELSYQYTPDLSQRYRNWENKDFLNILLLNEKGYLKGNLGPGEYVYDAEGCLTSYTGNGQQDTYTIKNGNVVARETIYSSGNIQRNTYAYDLSKASIPSPLTFRGQQSQNLLVKQTLVNTDFTSAGSQTTEFTYSYDFDQQGRPVREFVVADSESTPRSVREFIYQ